MPPHLIVREHRDVTSVKVIVMLDEGGGTSNTPDAERSSVMEISALIARCSNNFEYYFLTRSFFNSVYVISEFSPGK